jgi:hypothetical protein
MSNKKFLPVKDSCEMGEVGDILDPVGPLCQPTLKNTVILYAKVGTQIFLLARKSQIRKFLGSFRNHKFAHF